MKKQTKIIMLSLCMFPTISFAAQNYSDTTGIKKGSAIQNIYANTKKYYQENMNESSQDAVKNIAGDLGAKEQDVRAVIFGDDEKSKCANFIKNIPEIKLNGDHISSADLQQCQDILTERYHNFTINDMGKKTSKDAVANENIYADGYMENSSYDLLVDISELSKILFKEGMNIKLGSVKIESREEDNGDYSPKDVLYDKDKNGLTKKQEKGKTENSGNSKNEKTEEEKKQEEKQKQEEEKKEKTEEKLDNDEKKQENPKTEEEKKQEEKQKQEEEKKEKEYSKNKFIGKNPKVQLGNVCEVKPQTGEKTYNKISNLSDDFINLANNTSGNNGSGNNGSGAGNSLKNENKYNKIGFDSFMGENVKGGDLPGGVGGFFGGAGESSTKEALDAQLKKTGSASTCFGEDILSVCINLIPSGPRGPLGGDERKRSLEEIVDKILDTEKDMKEAFIIPAGHADESLGIDFKHVKLDQILAFNLVLNKKPVFPYADKKDKEKKENEADTECAGVPRTLAVIYNTSRIGNCFLQEDDKNKYLITNQEKAKVQYKTTNETEEKVAVNSAKGLFDSMTVYSTFNEIMLKTMEDISSLTRQQQTSSHTMLSKSQQ